MLVRAGDPTLAMALATHQRSRHVRGPAVIVALLALLLVGATPAQADEVFRLAPPTADVSVVQGQSAPVSIPLVASGVIECTDSATVSLSTLYFVGPAGGSAAGTPVSVRLGAGASVGDGDCVPAWAGTPSPYAAASVRADAHAAPGDYRVPLTLGVDGVESGGPRATRRVRVGGQARGRGQPAPPRRLHRWSPDRPRPRRA